jgi:hypothetical protein
MSSTVVEDEARYGPLLNVDSLCETEAKFVFSNPRNYPYVLKVRLRATRFWSPATFLSFRIVADDHCS